MKEYYERHRLIGFVGNHYSGHVEEKTAPDELREVTLADLKVLEDRIVKQVVAALTPDENM